jgi:hypothetical protein
MATCKCHGAEMVWRADNRPKYRAGGYWRCGIRELERQRVGYPDWSGTRYNRKLLTNRRSKALSRQRARHDPGGLDGEVQGTG